MFLAQKKRALSVPRSPYLSILLDFWWFEKTSIFDVNSEGQKIAVETFGRLGHEAETVLAKLAAAVRRRNISRGLPAGCALRRWRARISGLMARAFARALQAAVRLDLERGTRPRAAEDARAVSNNEPGE